MYRVNKAPFYANERKCLNLGNELFVFFDKK